MALNKKQSIILLHGATEFQKFEGMQKGELVIRHAADAKEAALYTLLDDGNTLVQFPSKDYVDDKFSAVNGNLNSVHDELTRLNNAITAETQAREEAIQDAKDDLHAEITAETKAREDAIASAKTQWEAADATLQSNINTVSDKVNTLEQTHNADKATLEGKISANTTAIETEAGLRSAADEKLTTDLTALSGTVTTLQATHKTDKDNLQEQITANATAIANEVTARTEAIANEVTARTQAIQAAKTELNNAITAETANRVAAVKEVNDKVDEFIGDDTELTAREIASEEVAKIVANADTAYDTLKEIADWILEHPESVAELNAKIQANAEAISALTKTHATDKDALQGQITANATAIANEVTARTEAIANEVTARTQAIQAAKTELNNAITAETANRVAAVKGVSDRLAEVEGSYIHTIVAEDAAGTSIVSVSEDKHTVTLNFDNFVIDGGTYE